MINVLMVVKRYVGNYPLLNEMARLDPQRFRVVVCYLGGENDGKNSLDALVNTYYLCLDHKVIRPWNVSISRCLAEILNREQIHLINCHLSRTFAVGVIAARFARNRPLVMGTLHGLGSAKSLRKKIANWFLYRHLARVIGVSDGVRKDILNNNWHLATQKVVTIYNGIEPGPFLQNPLKEELRLELFPEVKGKVWFGTVGRLTKVKNQKNLLLAFKRSLALSPENILLIAGQGEEEHELKKLAISLGIDGKVFFLGFRRDIARILAALDVFVLPSLREGFGLALVEAMCSGLPVIASQVGGIPEIFGDADVGVLVDPEDVDSITAAMVHFSQLNEAERGRLGRRARDRVLNNFTSAMMVDKYEKLYQCVCQGMPAEH